MLIHEVCGLLKKELLNNGYEYGFYANGKIYKPDRSKGFDEEFFHFLSIEYHIQAPSDTKTAKVGTCNDTVVLMKSILDGHNIQNKIWLLHNKQYGKFHTVLTFTAENKTVYLELTPQSDKSWYGKEIIFENEQKFIVQYTQNGFGVTDITNFMIVGKSLDFLISKLS